MKRSRTSSLAIRSSSRWRKRVSVSVSPWCFSGGGRSDFASSVTSSSETVSSPARERMIVPSAPTMSPRSSERSRSNASSPSTFSAPEQLDAPRAVHEVGEDRLALPALGGEAAGDAHARLRLPAGLEVVVALARRSIGATPAKACGNGSVPAARSSSSLRRLAARISASPPVRRRPRRSRDVDLRDLQLAVLAVGELHLDGVALLAAQQRPCRPATRWRAGSRTGRPPWSPRSCTAATCRPSSP